VDTDVPYMPSVTNLHKILDAIQKAGVPEVFNLDFLTDLGFTSSNDRAFIKVFKYLGMLDTSGRPQTPYREFVDHTRAKGVLANRIRSAFDDLYLSDTEAHNKSAEQLKGWFKTKTGASDAVAKKMATQFKGLASYADFDAAPPQSEDSDRADDQIDEADRQPPERSREPDGRTIERSAGGFGLVYRFEIHLPETQNVDTYRAIFRALREELNP